MKLDIHIHHHASAEDRERARRLSQSVAVIRETIEMSITPQIQEALDRIRQTQSLVQSYKMASELIVKQNGDLQAKVTELQAKLDAGGVIGPDDLAAIAEISSDIDLVNAQLQTAVPANTEGNVPTGSGANTSGSGSTGVGQQATNENPVDGPAPTAEEIAARGEEASGGPKPLAGTGG